MLRRPWRLCTRLPRYAGSPGVLRRRSPIHLLLSHFFWFIRRFYLHRLEWISRRWLHHVLRGVHIGFDIFFPRLEWISYHWLHHVLHDDHIGFDIFFQYFQYFQYYQLKWLDYCGHKFILHFKLSLIVGLDVQLQYHGVR